MALQNSSVDIILVSITTLLILLVLFKNREPYIKKTTFRDHFYGYNLIYADQKDVDCMDGKQKMLFSQRYNLQGKPDYIYQKRWSKKLVPVEDKSGKIGNNDFPHQGDLMQLAAYFLLIEDVYCIRPRKGFLRYQDGMFLVKNTAKIRKETIRTMEEMRKMLKTGKGVPNPSFVRCRYCLCNATVCEFCENK